MLKKICFITTGDIQSIATAKRALGLANPLSDLGWNVSIIMDDTCENRHRVELECDSRTKVFFQTYKSALDEIYKKNKLLRKIKPDIVYLCAFVFRNIVIPPRKCSRIVEHSELQSGIEGINLFSRIRFLIQEYASVIYSDGILNASLYLQNHFSDIKKKILRNNLPMLYYPYAYNPQICYIDSHANRLFTKNKDEKLFIFLGSLAENYGAFTMVKAFEKIKESNNKLKLILLGKGSAYEKIKTYIHKHKLEDTIYALGYIKEEDIPGYFTLADAFISPMNNTIQDLARCPSKLYMYLPYKKPIITCKIGEPYATLKDKGIYFEPSNSDSLSETIITLFLSKKWTLDIDPTEFSWEQRAIELHDWINKVL